MNQILIGKAVEQAANHLPRRANVGGHLVQRQAAGDGLTGSGRVKRNKAYHGHLFTRKSPKRLRNLRKSSLLASCDESRAKKMLAGGK
mgnify:CR=1 FL=1